MKNITKKIFSELINPQRDFTRKIIRYAWEGIEYLSSRDHETKKKALPTYVVDLDSFPVSFNIAELLLCAELRAHKENHEGYRLLLNNSSEKTIKNSAPEEVINNLNKKNNVWKLWNIIIGCLPLSPKLKDFVFLKSREDFTKIPWLENVYPRGYNLSFNKQPLDLWQELYLQSEDDLSQVTLTAPPEARAIAEGYFRSRNIEGVRITFVIRSQIWDPSRNSNLTEWIKVIRELELRNICVTVIPDSDNPFCIELNNLQRVVFRDPCWDVKLRMAIYESSDLVIGTHGGALALGTFSRNTRVIAMNRYPHGSITNNRRQMEHRMSSRPGKLRFHAMPYLKDKSTTKQDTAVNILCEIEEFLLEKEGKRLE